MSRSNHNKGRAKVFKEEGQYTGWKYELCDSAEAKRFVKKVTHKASRRFADKQIKQEILA